jgi:hypothetical protein
MKGYCMDCERLVEINAHGACETCGSESVLVQELRAGIRAEQLLERVNGIVEVMKKGGMDGLSILDEAALFAIVAKNHILRGMDVDQFIEDGIISWRVVREQMFLESQTQSNKVN